MEKEPTKEKARNPERERALMLLMKEIHMGLPKKRAEILKAEVGFSALKA